MTLSTATHDTFIIERTFDSPVASVFRAWADPNRKARWFAGSAGALGNGYELDFKVGGCEVNRGGPPGGPATVEFRESGGRTQLVLTEQGVFLDGHETAAQREEGTLSLLDSLAASLAADGP